MSKITTFAFSALFAACLAYAGFALQERQAMGRGGEGFVHEEV